MSQLPQPTEASRTFRLKPGSAIMEVMKFWDGNPSMTRQEVIAYFRDEATGHSIQNVDVIATYVMSRQADNYSIGRYVDVTPQSTVINVARSEDSSVSAQVARPQADIDAIKWPELPAIEDELDWYKKPSWYSRMKQMVGLGKHIALSGPPGIGKSTAVRALAAEMKMPLVHVSADVGLRRRDLTGSVELVNGSTQFVAAEYAAAAAFGWWVKVDEVNAAEPDALLYMNSQLEEPRRVNFHGRSYPVHKDFRCFVTYNPGLIGTKPLPQSFLDRFFPIKQPFPTVAQLRAMLLNHNGGNIDATVLDRLCKFGQEAWEAHVSGKMHYQITPRRLMDAIDLIAFGETLKDALAESVLSIMGNQAEVNAMTMVINKVV